MQNKRVLVVDDDERFGSSLADMLSFLDYEATVCTSAVQALAVTKSTSFHLIFTDVRMPEFDGLEFYKFLAAVDRELASRVIFVTGDIANPVAREVVAKTPAVCIQKPVAFDSLETAIAQTEARLRPGAPGAAARPQPTPPRPAIPHASPASAPSTAKVPVVSAGAENAQFKNELIALERQWDCGVIERNLHALDQLLAEEFTSIHHLGIAWNRSEYLSILGCGVRVIGCLSIVEMDVRVYADAAIVRGQRTVEETYKGRTLGGHYHFTHTWLRRGGRWRCVASQSTLARQAL